MPSATINKASTAGKEIMNDWSTFAVQNLSFCSQKPQQAQVRGYVSDGSEVMDHLFPYGSNGIGGSDSKPATKYNMTILTINNLIWNFWIVS